MNGWPLVPQALKSLTEALSAKVTDVLGGGSLGGGGGCTQLMCRVVETETMSIDI